jgi:hypothetical protein
MEDITQSLNKPQNKSTKQKIIDELRKLIIDEKLFICLKLKIIEANYLNI